MTHAYPSFARGPAGADAMLVAASAAIAILIEGAALRVALLASIAIVVAWGIATLHFPSRVEVDDDGVAFHRFGRAHRFAWSDVRRVRVRRFLVRDRVLVRVEPSGGAWRGRYWIDDRIAGFDALVALLESRAR